MTTDTTTEQEDEQGSDLVARNIKKFCEERAKRCQNAIGNKDVAEGKRQAYKKVAEKIGIILDDEEARE